MLKMAIFFKLIVEIKKKTYISYVFMYMYVYDVCNACNLRKLFSLCTTRAMYFVYVA